MLLATIGVRTAGITSSPTPSQSSSRSTFCSILSAGRRRLFHTEVDVLRSVSSSFFSTRRCWHHQSWSNVRVASAVSSGLLLRAISSRRGSSSSSTATAVAPEAPTKQDFSEILLSLRKEEPILERYLDTATDPWLTDFRELQPLREGENKRSSAVSDLEALKTNNDLKEVNYQMRITEDGLFFVLVACDVQNAGFVAGTGLGSTEEIARQLAAEQALERLVFPKEPVKEIIRCADAVRMHKFHSGARIPAIQAAETLAALEGKLLDVHVAAFRPCGKCWMAAIQCLCFDVRVMGPSADYDQEVALALAGEIFISRLRWYLRVPQEDPHAPHEWAATWDIRKAARSKPWGGRGSITATEILRFKSLGGEASEKALSELVADGDGGLRRRQLALAEATKARSSSKLTAKGRSSTASAALPEANNAVERRFEVTPTTKDPRRPELHGKLPVEKLRHPLGKALETSQVILVSGGTGSGKTTQLPQFILDDWKGEGNSSSSSSPPNIVVTQPRRLAAISVAERVAWERKEQLGKSVGYAVHANAIRPTSELGSIEFVTVGTLLRRAVDDSLLTRCDVVVVDEVHERDMLTDFLLILLREVLPLRPDLRLVLMSATLDVESFTNYFNKCPVLEVESIPLHPVEEVYLDDPFFEDFGETSALLTAEYDTRQRFNENKAADSEQVLATNSPMPTQMQWLGNDGGGVDTLTSLMEATICSVVPKMALNPGKNGSGALLCFLPGWAEIRQLQDRLKTVPEAKKIWALPLHSTLPKEQQRQVFERPPKGQIKVILGTNIAESSVTIDDVEVVIDSGLHRELTYDPKRRMSSLDTVWVSQSNAIQRRGRAGRVKAGQVLRLYSKDHFEAIPPRPSPEMQRCDLAQSCLQTVALGRDPRKFLADAIDPPSVAAVEAAIQQLAAIDAIDASEETPKLLPVGEVLAKLPLEPLLGRAAMLGCMIGMPEQTAALIVAAGGRSPFVGKKEEVIDAEREFCGWSDPLASAHALMAWDEVCQTKGLNEARKWAEKKLLSATQLATFSRDKAHLLRDMQRAGLARLKRGSQRDFVDNADVSGELLESRGEFEETLEELEQEDENNFSSPITSLSSRWADMEPFLATILCAAYPSNISMLPRATPTAFKVANFGNAVMSPASVNNRRPKFDANTWWLYGDLQASNSRYYLQGTTRVEEWQIALFGGLRVKELANSNKGMSLELDGWVQVGGEMRTSNDLLIKLRRELKDAFAWQALKALKGGADGSAAEAKRASEVLQRTICLLTGRNMPDIAEPSTSSRSSASVSSSSKTSKVKAETKSADSPKAKTASTGGASQDEFETMNLQQLKELLKTRGLKVTGKKAELIERLRNAK